MNRYDKTLIDAITTIQELQLERARLNQKLERAERDVKDISDKLSNMQSECYECENICVDLSPRGRCVICEHRRAKKLEQVSEALQEENGQLALKLEKIGEAYQNCTFNEPSLSVLQRTIEEELK